MRIGDLLEVLLQESLRIAHDSGRPGSRAHEPATIAASPVADYRTGANCLWTAAVLAALDVAD